MKLIIKTEEIHFEIEKEYEGDFTQTTLKELITKVADETIKIKKTEHLT
jgi:hypothetical protein